MEFESDDGRLQMTLESGHAYRRESLLIEVPTTQDGAPGVAIVVTPAQNGIRIASVAMGHEEEEAPPAAIEHVKDAVGSSGAWLNGQLLLYHGSSGGAAFQAKLGTKLRDRRSRPSRFGSIEQRLPLPILDYTG